MSWTEKITRKEFLESFPVYNKFVDNFDRFCIDHRIVWLRLNKVLANKRLFASIWFDGFSPAEKKEFFRILDMSKNYSDALMN